VPIPGRKRKVVLSQSQFNEADLAGATEYQLRMKPCDTRMESGDEPVRDFLRRTTHRKRLNESDFTTAPLARALHGRAATGAMEDSTSASYTKIQTCKNSQTPAAP